MIALSGDSRMKRIALAAVLLVSLVGLARAGFNEGVAAYNRGDYATALGEFHSLAEQGNTTAQSNLGVMYYHGAGVPQDYAEAANELTMLSVGIYGHVLPKQHGAPIRLVVPWKYGFKNIKSIVKIELAAKRPETFWNTLAPNEYGFVSNVNPKVPHPRWSQANERVIGTGQRQPTLLYNGYAAQVAHLYAKT